MEKNIERDLQDICAICGQPYADHSAHTNRCPSQKPEGPIFEKTLFTPLPPPATFDREQFTSGEWQIYKSDDFKRPYSIIIPHSLKTLNGSKPKTLAISIENKEDALIMAASKDLYYALKPFKLLAEEVLDVKDQPQIIYEFNGAKITTEDLSNVLKALLKASPNTLNK